MPVKKVPTPFFQTRTRSDFRPHLILRNLRLMSRRRKLDDKQIHASSGNGTFTLTPRCGRRIHAPSLEDTWQITSVLSR